MRIECPACQTPYDVPDAAFRGRARTMRCARCETTWSAGPPAPDLAFASAETIVEPSPSAASFAPPAALAPAPPSLPQQLPAAIEPPAAEEAVAEGGLPPVSSSAMTGGDQEAQDRFHTLLHSTRHNADAERREDIRSVRRRQRYGAGAWRVSVLLVLLIVALIFALHAQIMQVWPPSIRLYQALGLAK